MKRSSGGSPCRSSPRRRHSSCCLSIPAFECPEASFVLCASLVRQFEFAQHVWINDPNFHELGNERDPIIGNQDGTFDVTIPKETSDTAGRRIGARHSSHGPCPGTYASI